MAVLILMELEVLQWLYWPTTNWENYGTQDDKRDHHFYV